MKDWGCDAATSEAITDRFIEAEGNFIDTADMYSAGLSEAFRHRRVEQLDEALVSGEWNLTPEHRRQLMEVVPFARGYPQEWIEITKSTTEGHEV